jgi:hypothetical protein
MEYMEDKNLQCPLSHAAADRPQTCIHLSWRRPEDEGHDGVSCDFDVLERAHDVDFSVVPVGKQVWGQMQGR